MKRGLGRTPGKKYRPSRTSRRDAPCIDEEHLGSDKAGEAAPEVSQIRSAQATIIAQAPDFVMVQMY